MSDGSVPSVAALVAAFADHTPDAVLITARDGTLVYWNAGCTRIFGFAADEAVGASIDIIIPEGLRARHWHGWDVTMESGKTRYGGGDLLSVPALRKDGSKISVEFSIVPYRDASGTIVAVGACLRDVTARFDELKRLRKEVQRPA